MLYVQQSNGLDLQLTAKHTSDILFQTQECYFSTELRTVSSSQFLMGLMRTGRTGTFLASTTPFFFLERLLLCCQYLQPFTLKQTFSSHFLLATNNNNRLTAYSYLNVLHRFPIIGDQVVPVYHSDTRLVENNKSNTKSKNIIFIQMQNFTVRATSCSLGEK